MTTQEFEKTFKLLTNVDCFPWQEALFFQFAQGDIPSCCDLPTGLGKTSVVAIWLIALAYHPERVPRRLVYVVNRRTVVDQTTEEVEKLRRNLAAAGLDTPLRELCASDWECPLAISTLRGQFVDNREWSADPCRPAIIVGTVDMIGSRLLFSGYGVGFKTKPLHAGFLGQDALLVHDEAHLEPAFQKLLNGICDEQKRCGDSRIVRVMELTATTRSEGSPFQLSQDDEAHPIVAKRLNAPKELRLVPIADRNTLPEKLTELALSRRDYNCAILVFARSVSHVEKISALLKKNKLPHVETLTGTLRGKERDLLVKSPVFRRFQPNLQAPGTERSAALAGTVYLICTSAGEVGVNISGDHLICDLSTFESMAQRFGRVNRFGDREDTQIDVVYPIEFDQSDEFELRLEKTLDLLRHLNGSASSNSLCRLDAGSRLAAFAPPPGILPVSDILFDSWSLTSIRASLPGRPPVEPYLHGLAEYEPPQTQVAWREEVGIVVGDLLVTYPPADLLADYPLKPQEMIQDQSARVFDSLSKLATRIPTNAACPVWLVDNVGVVEVLTLGELTTKEKKDDLNRCTVLLPPATGGLRGGLLDGTAGNADDVADEWFDSQNRPRRIRIWNDDPEAVAKKQGMRIIRQIDTKPAADEDEGVQDESVARRYWHWYEDPTETGRGAESAQQRILLGAHALDVETQALRFANKLALSAELKAAVLLAARFHDLGKKRGVWQRSIGNFDPEIWLAKPRADKRETSFSPYRHEFGSLLDAMCDADFKSLPVEMKDVVLHLIAAHHGRARPHFSEEEALDTEREGSDSRRIFAEVPNCFARLQRQYGRWGLAYLESLLRAADYAASANPSRTVESSQ